MNLGVALSIKTGLLANGLHSLNEPIVHQDGMANGVTPEWHSMNLGVALCIETGLLANGVTPECCTQ